MRNYLRLLLSSFMVLVPFMLNAMTGRFFPHGLMSSSLVTNVCQDRYGYIWVGTEYGLNKFDGYHSRHIITKAQTMGLFPAILSRSWR